MHAKLLCVHTLQGVGVGVGPTFECVQFGLTARSPLLQNYLVIHGLEEAGTGEVLRRVGPVIGRTQISKLPYPSFTQLLTHHSACFK